MHSSRGIPALALHGILIICDLVNFASGDDFALMFGSLKTFQVHACEEEELRVDCPPHTVISIIYAQYGRPAGHNAICDQFPQTASVTPLDRKDDETPCASQNAIKVITKLCHEQMKCRLIASSGTFKEDPCPLTKKYAEVAYKCRPTEFINELTCESKTMNLQCGPGLGILIFSASYGSTAQDVLECPQAGKPQMGECGSSYVSETAISTCTGQRHCRLAADIETFGETGCSPTTTEQLKVAYACVPFAVLRPVGEQSTQDPSDLTVIRTTSYPAWAGNMDLETPPYLMPRKSSSPTFSGDVQMDTLVEANATDANERHLVRFFQTWLTARRFVTENRQRLILYLSLSLSVGFIFFVLVVFLHYYLKGAFFEPREKLDVPPITEDFFSDSDLENYEGDDSVPMGSNTLSRKISETIPRAPVSNDPETNHFFS